MTKIEQLRQLLGTGFCTEKEGREALRGLLYQQIVPDHATVASLLDALDRSEKERETLVSERDEARFHLKTALLERNRCAIRVREPEAATSKPAPCGSGRTTGEIWDGLSAAMRYPAPWGAMGSETHHNLSVFADAVRDDERARLASSAKPATKPRRTGGQKARESLEHHAGHSGHDISDEAFAMFAKEWSISDDPALPSDGELMTAAYQAKFGFVWTDEVATKVADEFLRLRAERGGGAT